IEYDASSLDDLRTLVRLVDAFSQGAAILDAKDPDAVRALVRAAYEEFERKFVRPAWEQRAPLVARYHRGAIEEDALPHDILTVLLLHRDDASLELADDKRVVREVATYLQGGTHTSAQTLVNALDAIFERPDAAALLGVRPDPAPAPERDLRTARFTHWLHYYVRFEKRTAAVS